MVKFIISFILLCISIGYAETLYGDVIKVTCGGGTIDILESIKEEFENERIKS